MKQGLFELADGGTLFIDEFGEMSAGLQVKLLRVLQDGTMRRVGSVTEQRVEVRVIAATNRDLEKEVAQKNFREDLFYRINVLGIHVPPLRNRRSDIPLLVDFFTGPDWQISDEVLCRLESYSWPGNIRQLQNAIERAKVLAEEDKIELQISLMRSCNTTKELRRLHRMSRSILEYWSVFIEFSSIEFESVRRCLRVIVERFD